MPTDRPKIFFTCDRKHTYFFGLIRIRKSKNDRQHNDQGEKNKMTNNIWQNQSIFLICIHRHFFLNDIDALVNFNGNFSKYCYIRNNRVSGQFAMCENLPWHRFHFNSQISIYFDIKQWFLIDIRKMNIILSMSMQTVKNSPKKTLKETQ